MVEFSKYDYARRLFEAVGSRGLNWKEYGAVTGGNHGSSSGILSRLHRDGYIARLTERRDGSSVYVSPLHIDGRPTMSRRDAKPLVIAEPTIKLVPSAPVVKPAPPAPMVDVGVLVDALEAVADLQAVAERAELEGRLLLVALEHEVALEQLVADRDALQTDRDALQTELTALKGSVKRERIKNAENRSIQESEKLQEAREAYGRGQVEGEGRGWQVGYDKGVQDGRLSIASSEDAAGEAFREGRILGRDEGEEMIRKRVERVSVEMLRVIKAQVPLRGHFNGCYQIHPECAVKALGRSAGIVQRPMGLAG